MVGIHSDEEFSEELLYMMPSIDNPSVSYIQARNMVLILSQSDE